MSESVDKKVLLGDLYDFYAQLLTEKQKEILDLYCMEDFSLAEISENLGISRQAVYDTVRKAERQMSALENQLGLFERHHRRKQWIDQALGLIREAKGSPEASHQILEQVEALLTQAAD